MTTQDPVLTWLLSTDPSIAWQVQRDLLSLHASTYTSTRAKIPTENWGAALLSHQSTSDGQWAGAAFAPVDVLASEWKEVGQPWTATSFALSQLREFGLDPHSAIAKQTVKLVGAHSVWEEGGQPFWDGETEECINGRVVADGAYFGVDVSALVQRLLSERQPDGGWNCERAAGSTCSSFATTLNVLEGLLELEMATGGTPESVAARKAGEEYLLTRRLFRRLSTGEPADERFLQFLHPNRWRYDVLRALDYFRAAALLEAEGGGGGREVGSGVGGREAGNDVGVKEARNGGWGKLDPRLAEAIEHVRSKRREDGKWNLDWTLPGRAWVQVNEGPGKPSPWITLRALRVLKWWDAERGG